MTLDLSLIEHSQVQYASPPIGCFKELLNYHWLLLKTCSLQFGFINWLLQSLL
jgi:hypothetical protein